MHTNELINVTSFSYLTINRFSKMLKWKFGFDFDFSFIINQYISSNNLFSYFQIEYVDEAEFMMTTRGNWKLFHGGYVYLRCHTHKSSTYWGCNKARWHDCQGKATTKQIGQKIMVRAYDQHNHPKEQQTSSETLQLWIVCLNFCES